MRSSPARAESPRPVLAPSKVPQRAPSFPEISSRYVFQAEADTAKEEGTSPLGHKASLSARLRSKVEKERDGAPKESGSGEASSRSASPAADTGGSGGTGEAGEARERPESGKPPRPESGKPKPEPQPESKPTLAPSVSAPALYLGRKGLAAQNLAAQKAKDVAPKRAPKPQPKSRSTHGPYF